MSILPYGGQWTKDKLNILKLYLNAYTTALKNTPFKLTYIDAFAGPGWWSAKSEYDEEYDDFQVLHKGSPRIAIDIEGRAFDRLIFIEKELSHSKKLEHELRQEFPNRNIEVINGDANMVLPGLCRDLTGMERAIVFLDPYATEVAWSTVSSIAKTKKIDCWILFPLMAISRIMPRNKRPDLVFQNRLDSIFGGRDKWDLIYDPSSQQPLFSDKLEEERPINEVITEHYRNNLNSIFEKVAPTKRQLKNSTGTSIFELIFAASNPTGADIAVNIADNILRRW